MGAQEEDTKSSTIGGVLPVVEVVTLVEKAKFYTSLCLGTTAILAVFAFLFLIPFVVEPAVTTILADFSPHAVACVVTDHVYAEGLKNCSWASCREGSIQPAHLSTLNLNHLDHKDLTFWILQVVPAPRFVAIRSE